MTYEDLRYETADGIAAITLNRPQTLNAYTTAMGQSLERAVAAVQRYLASGV